MRIPKILFIIGLMTLILGIVLVFAIPATVTWEPKSETLASEKPLVVSAGWQSKNKSLIDKVLTVSIWSTYGYWSGYKPFIYEEAKNFVIALTAIEQSSPQLRFNFYVFDGVNFDLWKAGKSYTSYYEAKGKTSVSFTFSIATKEAVPGIFYFVVEEYVTEMKPTVHVTATINWIEKTPIHKCSNYFMSWKFTFEEAKDFVLKGTAREADGNKFNFYIFDTTNYFNWMGGKSYISYYEVKNITTVSFSIPLTEEQAESILYFVAENPLLDVNETVKVSATLEWNEKATIAATIGGIAFGGFIAFIGFIIMIVAGIAAFLFKPKTS